MKKLLLLLFVFLSFWQTNAQLCWEKIACGSYKSTAIKTDGTLWIWGGGIGDDGYPEYIPQPLQIGTDSDWIETDTFDDAYFAIKTNGTLWAWGKNTEGRIGDGTTIDRSEPVQVGTDTNWKSVSVDTDHVVALKTNNTLWAWGKNNFNQLGDNSGINKLIPTQIGTDSNWQTISANIQYTTAIKKDGTLWKWGLDIASNDYSIKQVGTDTDWKIVRSGYYHITAIKNDGTLWTWGKNGSGELGLGYTSNFVPNPTKVGTSTWKDVQTDWGDSYAINTDGTLWKWGQNINQQIILSAPVLVNTSNDWASISVGQWFMIGIKNDGTLWGEGTNGFYQLTDAAPHDGPLVVIVTSPQLLNGCSVLSTKDNLLSQLSVYPNPAATTLTLANADNLNIEKLAVIDVTGKILLEQKSNASQLDVQELPAGMYFLEITANGTKQHSKFIKQ